MFRSLVTIALITGFPKGAPEALESRRAEDVSFGGTPLLGGVVWGRNPMGGGGGTTTGGTT